MNHLKDETSAYLLQHVNNPVDWYPWNEQTLELARSLDKPILLSIGYSACHWCHVMAHESFEDAATAELMNELFLNIKVDKEERPDLDKIYQTAHQILGQKPGGWPLTVALDPQTLLPYFAGTYFPKEAKFSLPPFVDVLEQLAQFYHQEKDQLQEHQQQLREIFTQMSSEQPVTQQKLSTNALAIANQQLVQLFDKHNGGFGTQPKFPQPSNLERLLRYSFYEPVQKEHCQNMLFTSLDKMAYGGIYDHPGGGFFRYSVDSHWMIPHFEKMLYDNAQLLGVYSDAYALNQSALYKHHLMQTAHWVMREMQDAKGGYYATLDADSEGIEGKFYVWNQQEVQSLLTTEEYKLLAPTFGLNGSPNFEGHWHLRVTETTYNPDNPILASALQKLFKAREQRTYPHRDEKIIVSWNGLMIKGMAKAGVATRVAAGQSIFIDSASRAVDFIYQNLWNGKRLQSNYQIDRARFNGYLDDYAYLLDGILQLLAAKWNSQHLQFSRELADALIENFWDEKNYGFFFTSHDHEQLIYRSKPLTDDALPSGNGIAAQALIKLSYLLGENRYLDIAQKTLLAAESSINHLPYAHNSLLDALQDYVKPPTLVIIRGTEDGLILWQQACQNHFDPQRCVFFIPNDETGLPSLLNEKAPLQETVAYICQGTTCLAPITDLEKFIEFVK